MKYDVVTNWDAGGTSWQGYVTVDYDVLEELFGLPEEGDGFKVDAEWTIKFEDGTIATIYNYKTGPSYPSGPRIPVENHSEWHVGGHSLKVVGLVEEIVRGPRLKVRLDRGDLSH